MSAPTDAARLAARIRPAGLPLLRQRWTQLLFLHWAWDPAAVQRTLPAGLTVDTHDGQAWVGVVPFFMRGVRPPFCPAVPVLSNFLELNVRTYVFDVQGRPGVWFYSLDANQWLAVELARAWFYLPYQHARLAAAIGEDGTVDYAVRREGAEQESGFRYRQGDDGRACAAGSREFFLVERYRLFAHDAERDRLFTGRVAHAPYRVSSAEVPAWDDGMLRLAGFDPTGRQSAGGIRPGRAPDHVCAAEGVDVEVFALERVEQPAGERAADDTLDTGALPA
jgi:uncharacterized protein